MPGVSRELVQVDWDWLHETGELSRCDPLTVRISRAAPRIGMTEDALAQSLRRLGVRNPAPSAVVPRARAKGCAECGRLRLAEDESERWVRTAVGHLDTAPESIARRRTLADAKTRLEWARGAIAAHNSRGHQDAA